MPLHADRIEVTKGTLLFAEGDHGTIAYLIERGRIEIFLPRPDGDFALVVRGPGEIVGEMAILDHGTRSASARTLEDCALCLISTEQIARRIERTDPILRMCLSVVIDRYRQTVGMLHQTGPHLPAAGPARPSAAFAAAAQTLSLESELRRAIAEDELELHFQPIVRMADRRLVGFEALMRWNHPERGLVSPASFIPIAEASGSIVELTAWCIAEVGRAFPRLLAAVANKRGADPLFMSLNISGCDFRQADFVNELTAMITRTGLSPNSIKLEVTESAMMDEPKRAAAVLEDCRARGLGIAIDDFGTGYSSLSYLSTLPITTIKIDQSFVRSMSEDPTSRKIVTTILRLAADLGIPVVAEGIETEAQAVELTAAGCAMGQGYLFARPQPIGATLDLIRNWTPLRRRLKAGLRLGWPARPAVSAA